MNRILPLLITLFIFNACQTDESEEQDGTGTLSIELGITIDENPIGGRTEDFVPLEDFVVIIEREDGTIFQQYNRAADVPAEIELPTGNYKVIAHSNNESPAEFENPYYYGESEMFSIDKEEFKVINVVCELANMKVTVTYSDNVVASFDSYATTVVNNTTADFLVFNETETREGYFSVDPLSISATLTFTKTDGSVVTKEFTGSVANPQPKTHYDIQVDAVIQDGQIAINLSLDESFNSEIVLVGDIVSRVLFTEYVEGSSTNKYLEITNLNTYEIDLSDYQLRRYSNGLTEPQVDNLTGLLSPGESIVYANPSANLYSGDVTISSLINFNGDDALDILNLNSGEVTDIFGQIGCSPNNGWNEGEHSTTNKTLRRKIAVSEGITTNPDVTCDELSFTSLVSEWEVYEIDNISGLGTH